MNGISCSKLMLAKESLKTIQAEMLASRVKENIGGVVALITEAMMEGVTEAKDKSPSTATERVVEEVRKQGDFLALEPKFQAPGITITRRKTVSIDSRSHTTETEIFLPDDFVDRDHDGQS